ncbi:MAG: hypothetical protein MUF51_06315, partial [Vicinamibacteria bacterium]|nr:hypothetical protein [Vicinamibacteria bacterium]
MIDNHVIEEARHYFTILHKRRVLVGTCLGVALLTAFLYNHTTRPVYEAHGRMLIEYQPPNIVPNQQIVARPEGGAVYFQTQNELLRGRELAERLVERMGLHKNAEFAA